jgi:hypothetical protein
LAPEKVILPKIPYFLIYAFDLRALADAHSMAFNFGLGFPKYEHKERDGDGQYLRLGLEYQYSFLWPEPFRIGTGVGYTFSSLRFPEASVDEFGERGEALFTGNGPHAVLSAHYYFTENFAIECAIRYRLLNLGRIATDLNPRASKLSEPIWQGMGELGLRGMFVF